jgi:hypothetical protein
MKKVVLALGFLGIIGALQVGCSGPPDNVGACKDHVQSVKELPCLGMVPSTDEATCDLYEEYRCNLEGYFDCRSSHYVCNGDALDAEEYAKLSECNELTFCN